MQKYVIMGIQGCGKGTQAKLLAAQYDLTHISVGDIFPGGHPNFPHLWPGQLPPPGRRRDGCILGLRGSLGNPGRGLLQPPALAFEPEQVPVVHQAVQQRCHHHDVPQQLRPVLDHAV